MVLDQGRNREAKGLNVLVGLASNREVQNFGDEERASKSLP